MSSDETVPPPLPQVSHHRAFLVLVLSIGLGAFIVDGFVSLADDSLNVLAGLHWLGGFRMASCWATIFLALVVYVLMAITPAVPKRWFLPMTWFTFFASLLLLPCMIYRYELVPLMMWVVSLFQVVLGLWILFSLQGAGTAHWPLVPAGRLNACGFSWRNLLLFTAANLFGLLPCLALCLAFGVAAAVHHFSAGFMALHPSGITVQVRTYVRDGKTVELFPMSHIADAGFYHQVSQTFPSNSIILMEGVTDQKHLLTNGISYRRAAKSLGLSEQHEAFVPQKGTVVRADVDVSVFSADTLDLLNVVMKLHGKGMDRDTLRTLFLYPAPPDLLDELCDDLVVKRNRRLLEELNTRLPETGAIMVPWGVAHMPQLDRDLRSEGFQLKNTRDFTVIRFWKKRLNSKG